MQLSQQPLLEPAAYTLLSQCPDLEQVVQMIDIISKRETSVMIKGETGVGKELVAKAIHEQSPRAENPLITVECNNQNRELMASELFGHERGSFTGAHGQHIGFFETAHKGTIFLDEIGELPMEFQSRLLRILDEKTFNRVGGTEKITSDFRMIAASNRDLKKMVKEGGFREDLFYRLNVFPLSVPPLRKRAQDIIPLSNALMSRLSGDQKTIAHEAHKLLCSHRWPGNVRQLKNVLERALIISDEDENIGAEHISFDEESQPALRKKRRVYSSQEEAARELANMSEGCTFWQTVECLEKAIIERALEKTGSNMVQTAHLLSISHRTLYKKMRDLGMMEKSTHPKLADPSEN